MVLEIGRVVVYAATSLSRTVKPMLEEPGGGAERAGRRGLSTAQIPPGEPRHHFSCHGLWQECASNSWQCRQPRLPERSPGASRSILRNQLITGEIYDQIIIDGIYLSHHWCLLIATNESHVIGWQWCDRESVAAWQALLSRFPAPTVVITDGGPGALKAIRQCWPATGVQRCLFHVWLNTKTDLTGHRKPLPARHYCASEATSPPSTLSTKPPHGPPNSTIDGTLTGISPANEPTTPAGNQDNNTGGTPTTGFDAPTCT